MQLLFLWFNVLFLMFPWALSAQYHFSGHVDTTYWPEEVYLSLVEDYRKISGVYPEQIIQKTTPDSTGYFSFLGDHLPTGNHIYRIHVHNCSEKNENNIHFNGFCPESKEVFFIAKNSDTLSLPFSFDREMFCKVTSTNEKSNTFIKADSIIDEMQFAFSNYRSQTSRKINANKWLSNLQQFGKRENEPLIELYIYAFLSNKSNELYAYYLKDLKNNSYYEQLLERLKKLYPNSTYTKQYEAELASDNFLLNPEKITSKHLWIWILSFILLFSLLLNALQFFVYRRKKSASHTLLLKDLTHQEQKILDLILTDKTNKEIASAMFVSVSTVKTHINNLYKKLNTSSREEVKSLYTKK